MDLRRKGVKVLKCVEIFNKNGLNLLNGQGRGFLSCTALVSSGCEMI